MKQELFTTGQLLKSNDGKEYVIFKFYLKDGRKCEECMPFFRGKKLGVALSEIKRATEDFHVVSDVERQFVEDAIEFRDRAANTLFEARHKLSVVEKREDGLKEIAGLDESVVSISDILDGMTKGIDDVIRYTAKDYIKGETVKKDLDNIRKILEQIKRVTTAFSRWGGEEGEGYATLLDDDCF